MPAHKRGLFLFGQFGIFLCLKNREFADLLFHRTILIIQIPSRKNQALVFDLPQTQREHQYHYLNQNQNEERIQKTHPSNVVFLTKFRNGKRRKQFNVIHIAIIAFWIMFHCYEPDLPVFRNKPASSTTPITIVIPVPTNSMLV